MILNDLNLCIVDIETTGAKSLRHRIIEIGVAKIEKGKLVDQFHSLINPQQPVPPSITEFTGITDADVSDSPIFEDIHRSLLRFLDGHIFVAHNVIFDYGFIRHEFDRLGIAFNPERFCSVRLSRLIFPGQSRHDLSSIVERYNIPLKNRHRALDDALGVWEFFKVIGKEISEGQQHAGLAKVLKNTQSLPVEIALNIDHLPYAPGVYMLYDADDVLLYVDKSNDIRSKVWDQLVHHSKFSSQTGPGLPLVKRVDFIETQGKLGALLLESHWIKKYRPLFNRRSKALDPATVLSLTEDGSGYKHVVLEELEALDKENIRNAYTVFRTKKHALKFLENISKNYKIGKTYLGLPQEEGTRQHLEKAVVHNMRLIEALSKHPKINWPFNGPVVIEENNARKTKGEAFVIDQWIIQKAIKYKGDMEDILFEVDGTFDFDTYKILFNYLNRNKRVQPLVLRTFN